MGLGAAGRTGERRLASVVPAGHATVIKAEGIGHSSPVPAQSEAGFGRTSRLHDGAFLFWQPNWGGTTGDFGPRPYGMRAFLFVAWVHLSASHSRDLARCGGTVL